MPEGAKPEGGNRKGASKADGPKLPRVPLPVDGIQVNTCKTIGCENFGAEPLPKVSRGGVKAGESRKADGFRVDGHNTVKGWKRLRCTKCGGHTTFKSNAAIKEEFDRITRPFARQAGPACQNPECSNFGLDVASHPRLYHAHGKTRYGSPRWRCKACRRPVTLKKVGRTERLTHENLNIFRLLVLKNPIRSIIKFTQLNPKVIYDKIDIIHRQCVAFAADRERQLPEKEFPSLFISCDRQDYMVNWSNSEDKRLTQLTAIASADNISGYIFGHHVNFDPDHEQVDVRQAARECGDFRIVEPAFRRFARLWLEEEMEQAALRDPGLDFPPPPEEGGVEHLIDARSAEMAAVPDPEALERVFESSRTPKTGMQIHFEYTVHAHFRLLAKLLVGARKLRFYTDQDDTIRSAILNSFKWPVIEGRVEAFFVRIDKSLDVHSREALVQKSAKVINDTKKALDLPMATDHEIVMHLVAVELRRMAKNPAAKHWRDRWLYFPISTMHEPDKAVCHITTRSDYDLDDPDTVWWLAKLYSRASLHAIDRYFMQVRRLISLLERPISTPSNVGKVWRGYGPYNPRMVQKLLDIFRVVYNYVELDPARRRKEEPTPAMKLGLAKGYVRLDDILYFEP